jgi:hypothetical protein
VVPWAICCSSGISCAQWTGLAGQRDAWMLSIWSAEAAVALDAMHWTNTIVQGAG